MKKIMIALVALVMMSGSAFASQGEAMKGHCDQLPQQNMKMCDGKMAMMCPMSDLMQAMLETIKTQQKLIVSGSASEKKELAKELDNKIAAIEADLTKMKTMPMPCMQAPPCAPVSKGLKQPMPRKR
jgi:hypothetical protein